MRGNTAQKKDAKRALSELFGDSGGAEREEMCLEGAPLETLRERGEPVGLSAFLGEVEEHLFPLFSSARRHPS